MAKILVKATAGGGRRGRRHRRQRRNGQQDYYLRRSDAGSAHHIPFYVAAPTSIFDLSIATGDEITIEVRGAAEITHGFGRQTAPNGIQVYTPAFDVTPAWLIAAIVCKRGVTQAVTRETVKEMIVGGR